MPTYDPVVCNQKLSALGYKVCQAPHCNSLVETPLIHQLCGQEQSTVYTPVSSTQFYSPIRTPHLKWFSSLKEQLEFQQSAEYKAGQWTMEQCWCCCSCYAYGTPISVNGGTLAIQNFAVGDKVLAASVDSGRGGLGVEWSEQEVRFSSGTGPESADHNPPMIYINYGDNKGIIVSTDELFLTPEGKVLPACKLAPGMELVDGEGKAIALNGIRIGQYKGGLHHIATTMKFTGSIDNHLLNSNGVITGDYTIQIHYEELGQQYHVKDWDKLPTIGTPEYDQEYGNYEIGYHAYQTDPKSVGLPVVSALSSYSQTHSFIPETAYSYFTEAQEADILAKVDIHPFGNHAGVDDINYLFKIFKSFYPDVTFYMDWNNINPNAYAFNDYGQKFIIIPGGLIRVTGLNIEAKALILASMLGNFYGGKDETTTDCRGVADYYSGLIIRKVFYNNWFNFMNNGITQISALFSKIENDKPGSDTCKDPGLECRLEAYMAAMSSFNLPTCAGGPVPHSLKVTGDEVGTTADGKYYVIVNFNKFLEVPSATDIRHYSTEPKAELASAEMVQDDRSKVLITGDFAKDTQYTLTVKNVVAEDYSTLDPKNNTALFKTH